MNFEDKLQEGRFCIPECKECKKIVWPPSETCSNCFGDVYLKNGQFEGKIIEFSREKEEYFCMVEFEQSLRIMATMSSMPQIGQVVKISECGIQDENYFFKIN